MQDSDALRRAVCKRWACRRESPQSGELGVFPRRAWVQVAGSCNLWRSFDNVSMAAPHKPVGCADLFSGDSLLYRWRREHRRGSSLIELLVVFFIISIMLALLLPALQGVRARADATSCQNNVRQVGWALSRYIDTQKRFPLEKQWTIAVLKYIEEDALADTLAHGVSPNIKYARPRVMRCPSQTEVDSSVEGVNTSPYVLVVDRPVRYWEPARIPWVIQDREELSNSKGPFDPWYSGPEISFVQQRTLFAAKQGPHQSGIFYDSNGQTHGGD